MWLQGEAPTRLRRLVFVNKWANQFNRRIRFYCLTCWSYVQWTMNILHVVNFLFYSVMADTPWLLTQHHIRVNTFTELCLHMVSSLRNPVTTRTWFNFLFRRVWLLVQMLGRWARLSRRSPSWRTSTPCAPSRGQRTQPAASEARRTSTERRTTSLARRTMHQEFP